MLILPAMKTDDAIRRFNNSVRELAQSLGITSAAIYQWGDTVPALRVYQIREILAEREKVGASDTAPETVKQAA